MIKDKMMAVIKGTRGPGVHIIKCPVPKDLKEDEVLIKVLATSICGTDYHIYQDDEWSQKRTIPPFITGHEFCGEVVLKGSQVKGIDIGDRVSAETHLVCQSCEFCRRGEAHICKETKIIGVDCDGCFAEYIKLPAYNLIVNDQSMDPRILSIQEPLGNAVHTMLHFDIIGKTVAVVGCGPIGLMGVAVAKAVGAKTIIAIEPNEFRLDLAKTIGADVLINPRHEDVFKRVMEATNQLGVDVIGEFSGNKGAIEKTFKYIKPGGKLSMLGLGNEPITLDLNDLVFKGITVYGVTGRKMFTNWQVVKGLLQSGRLNLEPLITHEFRLDQIDEAMAVMASGNSGKIVLIP